MILSFTKYHGTGNDFIMIDSTKDDSFYLSNEQIRFLCDRRFGIGADGLILIYKEKDFSFKMQYHNADGTQSFCGNGARCAVHFSHSLNLFTDKAVFLAIDGVHEATLNNDTVTLKMNDVEKIQKLAGTFILDTGSPHYVKFTEDVATQNMVEFGKKIRYSSAYKEKGINVNLVEILDENQLKMRTYERGVEDETYSCGTGATAAALAYAEMEKQKEIDVNILVKGGALAIKAKREHGHFSSIYLTGPAQKVFEGKLII